MVEKATAVEVSKVSVRLSAIFGCIGIGLLYLAILLSDASDTTKILWASTLSFGVAILFLVIWSMIGEPIKITRKPQ